MLRVSADSTFTNGYVEHNQKRKQSTDFGGSKSKLLFFFIEEESDQSVIQTVQQSIVSAAFPGDGEANMLARTCGGRPKCRSKKCGECITVTSVNLCQKLLLSTDMCHFERWLEKQCGVSNH